MLDFDEEIKKFDTIPETKEIEKVVYDKELVDVTDIINEILNNKEERKKFVRN